MVSQLITREQISLSQNPIYLTVQGNKGVREALPVLFCCAGFMWQGFGSRGLQGWPL